MESLTSFNEDQSFTTFLQCPICIEFFTIPVFQCDSGHSICDSCSRRTSRCPTCKASIGRKLRNYLLQSQLQALVYHCRFPECNMRMKLCERVEHQQKCGKNPILNCLLQNCRWKGHKNQLTNHLNSKHKIPHYDICGNTAEYSSRLRSNSLPSTAGCVKLLHTFFMSENQQATVLTYIFMDSQKNLFYPQFRSLGDAPVRYRLRIWNTEVEDSDQVVISGRVNSFKCSLDEERENKQCISLDLESMINKFAFQDKFEEGHKLLHYRLSIDPVLKN